MRGGNAVRVEAHVFSTMDPDNTLTTTVQQGDDLENWLDVGPASFIKQISTGEFDSDATLGGTVEADPAYHVPVSARYVRLKFEIDGPTIDNAVAILDHVLIEPKLLS